MAGADKILVIGSSSSGKTASLRTLNSKSTVIISCEKNRLSFKGSNKFLQYNITNYEELIGVMSEILTKDKNKNVKTIILDDYGYLMSDEYMKTALETGYSKYTVMAVNAYNGFKTIPKELCAGREDITIIYIMHPQKNDLGMYTPKTIGKVLDDKICIEGMFDTVLFARVNDNNEYVFMTRTTVDIPSVAKTPMDMFEQVEIPNDMDLVLRTRAEYYGTEYVGRDEPKKEAK